MLRRWLLDLRKQLSFPVLKYLSCDLVIPESPPLERVTNSLRSFEFPEGVSNLVRYEHFEVDLLSTERFDIDFNFVQTVAISPEEESHVIVGAFRDKWLVIQITKLDDESIARVVVKTSDAVRQVERR